MFNAIYKKLKEDFSFLNEFGFFYKQDLRHFVTPSVLFENGDKQIQIGLDYSSHKFYAKSRYFI